MSNKPKHYLKNVNFDFEKSDEVSYNPHIAYTLGSGAASRHNDAYLLKSLEDFDILSTVFVMKANSFPIPDDILKKAQMSSSNLRNMLRDVVRDTYGDDTWIADFNDKVVVFMDGGIFYAQTYKHRKGSYDLTQDRANVIQCEYFQLDPNNVVSDEVKESLLNGSDIIIKSEDLELGVIASLFEADLLKASVKKDDDESEEEADDEIDDTEEEEEEEDDEEIEKYLKSLRIYKKDDETSEGAEPRKTVSGKKYPADDFAYTPDKSKPSTWKLPLFNAEHAKLAQQALTSGIWGNKVKIPSKDLASVKRKVAAANKKFKTKVTKTASELGVAENQNPDQGVYKVDEKQFAELQKSMADMEALLKASQEDNLIKAAQLESLQKAETTRLTKSYGSIVKCDAISEEIQAEIVTEMLKGEEVASLWHVVFKAFKDEAEAKDAEVLKVKEEFATTEHGSSQLKVDLEAENDPVTVNKAARLEALKATLEKTV